MGFPADELIALLHRHHALDNVRKNYPQSFERLMRQFIANGADDDSSHPAHHVRLITPFADLLEDSGLLFLGDIRFENNDHNGCAAGESRTAGQKNRRRQPAADWVMLDFLAQPPYPLRTRGKVIPTGETA